MLFPMTNFVLAFNCVVALTLLAEVVLVELHVRGGD